MKTCPQCHRKFPDDINYCLEDGVRVLSQDADEPPETLTLKHKIGSTSPNQNVTDQNRFSRTQQTENFKQPRNTNRSILPKVILVGGILVFFLGIILVAGTLIVRELLDRSAEVKSISTVPKPPPKEVPTPIPEQELKVEILNKVKGGLGDSFVKVKITNTSESIIKINSNFLTLSFYKNDVKLDTGIHNFKLRYLKPNQSIPVWINLHRIKNYTSVKLDKPLMGKPVNISENEMYYSLKFTDLKMTSKMGILTLNGRPLRKIYYQVNGIVQSTREGNARAKAFILFYDKNSEIVGMYERSLIDLKKDEKNKFEAQIGEYDLFGKPQTFKIISIKEQRF